MAMFKGLLGGLAGAFGYSQVSQYETKDIASGLLGILARDSGGAKPAVAGVDPNMAEFTKQLRDLQTQLHMNRQPVTIVTGQTSNKGWGYIVVPTSMLGVVLLYLRFVKGWRISDMMYVTRASLHTLKDSVTDMQAAMVGRLGKMQEDVNQKTKLLAQHLGLVGEKQDNLLEQQEHLDEKLTQLGEDVDGRMTEMHGDVRGIQTNLGAIEQQVQQSNQGMFVLCHAIADVCRAVNFNGKSVTAIEGYLQNAASTSILPPPQAATSAPLQTLPLPVASLESLLPRITEDGEGRASTSQGPSSQTPSALAASRNNRAKSDASDARSQGFRSNSYFNMFTTATAPRPNRERAASLPL